MTTYAVIQAIKLALDKYSTSTSAVIGPAFLDEEICEFANQAMVEIICNKFTGNNQLKQSFEQSVKRISDFSKLIKTYNCDSGKVEISGSTINTRSFSVDTEDKLLFPVTITVVNNDGEYIADIIDRQTAKKYKWTVTNKPWVPTPKVVIGIGDNSAVGDILVYYDPDMTAPTSILAEYVVQPTGLSEDNIDDDTVAFDGVFSDAVLYEIINRAALLMLDNIESQRTQIKAELNNIQE